MTNEKKGFTSTIADYPERGEGGNQRYRGNCSPKLIEDLIRQYSIRSLSDYMVGSGTTRDVCNRLRVQGDYLDLNCGFDLIAMDIPSRPENIFWHPPYHDIIVYSGRQYKTEDVIRKYGINPQENYLSRCGSWDEFVRKMNYCMIKQFVSLEKGGRMFVLMGDIKKKGHLYSMLCDIAKPGTLEQIIIKMQHNCVSDRRQYSGNFIPIAHEYLMVVRKDLGLFYDISLPTKRPFDIRDSLDSTWRDVVASVLEDAGKPLALSEIYQKVEGHRKARNNSHWTEKIRQTLYCNPNCFRKIDRGVWALAA